MNNPFNKRYLKSLASRLKKQGWEADTLEFDWDDHDQNTYLLRYGHNNFYCIKGSQPMLLMGDFGITWEPARAYPTEAFDYIEGENPDEDVDKMIKIALEYYKEDDEVVKKVTTWQILPGKKKKSVRL